MDANVKQLWISALRSGEYGQAIGVLHSTQDDTYCCLGVLCEVAIKNGVYLDVDHGSQSTRYNNHTAALPYDVMKWSGLGSDSGELEHYLHSKVAYEGEREVFTCLAQLNDEGSFDFNQIADIIDNQF